MPETIAKEAPALRYCSPVAIRRTPLAIQCMRLRLFLTNLFQRAVIDQTFNYFGGARDPISLITSGVVPAPRSGS